MSSFGISKPSLAVRQGLHFLRAELPSILANRTDVLSSRRLRSLSQRILLRAGG
jgi:hypothetical protein